MIFWGGVFSWCKGGDSGGGGRGVNTLEEAAAGRKARGRLKGLKHPLCVCVCV